MDQELYPRDEKGRLLPGNKLATLPRKRRNELHHTLMHCVTEQDIRDVMARVISIAKTGSDGNALKAAAFIRDTLFGRPQQYLEVSQPEAPKSPEEMREELSHRIKDLLQGTNNSCGQS